MKKFSIIAVLGLVVMATSAWAGINRGQLTRSETCAQNECREQHNYGEVEDMEICRRGVRLASEKMLEEDSLTRGIRAATQECKTQYEDLVESFDCESGVAALQSCYLQPR